MSYLSARSFTLSSFSSIFNLLTLPVTFPEIDVGVRIKDLSSLTIDQNYEVYNARFYCVGDSLHPFQRLGDIWFYYLCFGSLFNWIFTLLHEIFATC